MQPTAEMLGYQVNICTDIKKLKFLRDTGLDMILVDPDVDDFTESDKTEFINIINKRIIYLGGEI